MANPRDLFLPCFLAVVVVVRGLLEMNTLCQIVTEPRSVRRFVELEASAWDTYGNTFKDLPGRRFFL